MSKRSRVDRSPSLAEVCLLQGDSQWEKRTRVLHSIRIWKKSLVSRLEQHRRTIFSLCSESGNESSARTRFGEEEEDGFLKACCRCKKRIGDKDTVFMYSDFGYCSPECRAKQIELDSKLELENLGKPSQSSTIDSMFMVNHMKGQTGGQSTNGELSQ